MLRLCTRPRTRTLRLKFVNTPPEKWNNSAAPLTDNPTEPGPRGAAAIVHVKRPKSLSPTLQHLRLVFQKKVDLRLLVVANYQHDTETSLHRTQSGKPRKMTFGNVHTTFDGLRFFLILLVYMVNSAFNSAWAFFLFSNAFFGPTFSTAHNLSHYCQCSFSRLKSMTYHPWGCKFCWTQEGLGNFVVK